VKYARVVVRQPGGLEVLQIVEEEAREPKAGEVRVKVLATAVSYADLLMREGVHPETPATPFTPGWDLVGRVDRLGDGVSGFEPGPAGIWCLYRGRKRVLIYSIQRLKRRRPTGTDRT
jgi:NADPH:quinone reductase